MDLHVIIIIIIIISIEINIELLNLAKSLHESAYAARSHSLVYDAQKKKNFA